MESNTISLISELQMDRNIDRLVPYKNPGQFVSSSYHVVKDDSGNILRKEGDLCLLAVEEDTIKLIK